jgi:hypothetical protein
MPQARPFAPWPAAPAAPGATIVMFTTAPRPSADGRVTLPSLENRRCSGLHITWHKNDQASAANGLRIYASDDGGTTWYESDLKNASNAPTIGSAAPVTVPILAAGQEWHEFLELSRYRDFAVEYTAGGVAPTPANWKGTIAVISEALAVEL